MLFGCYGQHLVTVVTMPVLGVVCRKEKMAELALLRSQLPSRAAVPASVVNNHSRDRPKASLELEPARVSVGGI